VYRWWVAARASGTGPDPEPRIHDGLAHLVLDEAFIDRLGPGINSGKSVFLFGHPGNGKTEIAFSIAEIMGARSTSRAVEMEGQVIQVYDPHVHSPAGADGRGSGDRPRGRRSPAGRARTTIRASSACAEARGRRGGELTLDELDLRSSGRAGVFIAPPQMKANGGVFVIDDFGRQRVRPRDLLNRWMIPWTGVPTTWGFLRDTSSRFPSTV
jgi:predicted ATPase with chaperone activity